MTTIKRDLNDVRIFINVVDAGSFSGAARALRVPTSTVSRRVARLEDVLGVRLLQRTTRKLSLTEAGQLYYERGVGALAGLDEAENIIQERQQSPRGRLRVAAPAEHGVTMKVVNRFLADHPDVQIDLELTGRSVNILEEGYDISIHAGDLFNLSVVAHKLMDSPFVMVASKAYLAANGEPTTAEQLTDFDCVVFGVTTTNAHWNLVGKRGRRKTPIHGRLAVNNLQGVREAALADHGLALLPLLVCAEDIRDKRLVVVLGRSCPPPVPIYVTYAAGRYTSPAVRAFVDFLRANFEPLANATGPKRRTSAKSKRRSSRRR